jgi:phage tail-like protein
MFPRIIPTVNFRFIVEMGEDGDISGEYYFSKVTGIEMKLNVTPLLEGGNSNNVFKLPGATEYSDLVLHQGLVPVTSKFFDWCQKTIGSDYNVKIKPEDVVTVRLLDELNKPLVSWEFTNVYPIGLKVGDLDAQNQAILIEELTLTYSKCDRVFV